MKKMCGLLLAAIVFVAFKTNVLALDPACTPTEQLRLRQLVALTQVTYEFYEIKEEATRGFNVTVSGFSPDFYVYDIQKGTYFKYNGNSVVVNGAFAPGMTYNLPFYASDEGVCKGYLITTKTIVLPNYNAYSTDPACIGNAEYELCKKFTSITLPSYSEFRQRLAQYIKDKNKPEENKPEEEKPETHETFLEKIEKFLSNNYMVILVSIIVVGTSAIVTIEVRKRRSIL
jgi:hypothetical protein